MQPECIQAYVLSSDYFILSLLAQKDRRTGGQQCHLWVRLSSVTVAALSAQYNAIDE